MNAKNIEDLTSAFLSVGLTAQEQAELQQLLKDPDNKACFRKMYVIWHASNHTVKDEDVERALQKALFRVNNFSDQPLGEQIMVRRRFTFWRVAAAVVALIGGVSLYYTLNTRELANKPYIANTDESAISTAIIPVNKVTVPLGSKSTVELPDGTIVTLNAGSCMQYAASFGKNSREIILEGEGYFKVVRNEAIPFVVRVKDVTIKVLGTEFNVTAYPEEQIIWTTLVKGSVSIRKENGNDSNIKEVILKPQQTATIKYTTESSSEIENALQVSVGKQVVVQESNNAPQRDVIVEESVRKTVSYTSWKDARWAIESEPLEELAIKLQRRYNVNIIIKDDDLKRYPFSGTLTDETLEQVLEIMKSTVPISYTVKHKTVWIEIDPQRYKVFEKLMKK